MQLFGINSEGIPKQVNYLSHEADTIREDGKGSYGPNTVVSLVHHFLHNHGHGEKGCRFHADNCGGQKKNKTVIAYLAWRVMCGHEQITLSFMVAGHTRCLVDGCFGLLKQKYRRSDCFTMEQLVDVVNLSVTCNVAETVPDSGLVWRQWDAFLLEHFKSVVGIRKLHHFRFDSTEPCVIFVKETCSSAERKIKILKTSKEAVATAGLPLLLPRGGLSPQRRAYLHKHIRPFVAPAHQDELCPAPPDQDVSSDDNMLLSVAHDHVHTHTHTHTLFLFTLFS